MATDQKITIGLSLDAKEWAQGIKKAGGEFSSGFSNIAKTAQKVSTEIGQKFGKTFSEVAGGAFNFNNIIGAVSTLKDSFNQLSGGFVALDTATGKIKSLGGEAAAMADQLSKMSREVGPRMGVTAVAIQNISFDALAAGIKGGVEGIEKFAVTAAKLATAAGTDTATATQALTGIMNTYGIEAGRAGEVSDVLNKSIADGVFTADQWAQSATQVLPTAKALGIGFKEIAAGAAVVTSQGTPFSVFATRTNTLLTELARPAKNLAPILAQAGVSLDSIKAEGLQVTLAKVQKALQETGKTSVEVFGSAEAAGGFELLTSNAGAFANELKSIEQSAGATETAYDAMSGTIENRVASIKAQFDGFFTNAFAGLGKNFVVATKSLEALAPAMTSVTGAASLLGPVFKKNEEGVSLFSASLDGIKDLGGTVSTNFKTIAASSGELAKGIGTSSVGIIKGFPAAFNDASKAIVSSTTNMFKNAGTGAINASKQFASGAGQMFSAIGTGASKAVETLGNRSIELAKNTVNRSGDIAKSVVNAPAKVFGNLASSISGSVSAVTSATTSAVTGTATKISDVGKNAITSIKDVGTKAVSGLKAAGTGIGNAFKALGSFMVSPAGIVLGVLAAIGLALVALYKNVEGFRNFVDNAFTFIGDVITNAWTIIKEFGLVLFEIGKAIFQYIMIPFQLVWGIIQPIWQALTELGGAIAGMFASSSEGAAQGQEGIGSWLTAIFGFFESIKSIAQRAGEIFSNIAVIANRIGKFIGNMIVGYVKFFINVYKTIFSIVSTIFNFVLDKVYFILSIIGTVLSSAYNLISGVFTSIVGFITGIFAPVAGLVGNLLAPIGDAVSSVFSSISGAASGLLGEIFGSAPPEIPIKPKLEEQSIDDIDKIMDDASNSAQKAFDEINLDQSLNAADIASGKVLDKAQRYKSQISQVKEAYADQVKALAELEKRQGALNNKIAEQKKKVEAARQSGDKEAYDKEVKALDALQGEQGKVNSLIEEVKGKMSEVITKSKTMGLATSKDFKDIGNQVGGASKEVQKFNEEVVSPKVLKVDVAGALKSLETLKEDIKSAFSADQSGAVALNFEIERLQKSIASYKSRLKEPGISVTDRTNIEEDIKRTEQLLIDARKKRDELSRDSINSSRENAVLNRKIKDAENRTDITAIQEQQVKIANIQREIANESVKYSESARRLKSLLTQKETEDLLKESDNKIKALQAESNKVTTTANQRAEMLKQIELERAKADNQVVEAGLKKNAELYDKYLDRIAKSSDADSIARSSQLNALNAIEFKRVQDLKQILDLQAEDNFEKLNKALDEYVQKVPAYTAKLEQLKKEVDLGKSAEDARNELVALRQELAGKISGTVELTVLDDGSLRQYNAAYTATRENLNREQLKRDREYNARVEEERIRSLTNLIDRELELKRAAINKAFSEEIRAAGDNTAALVEIYQRRGAELNAVEAEFDAQRVDLSLGLVSAAYAQETAIAKAAIEKKYQEELRAAGQNQLKVLAAQKTRYDALNKLNRKAVIGFGDVFGKTITKYVDGAIDYFETFTDAIAKDSVKTLNSIADLLDEQAKKANDANSEETNRQREELKKQEDDLFNSLKKREITFEEYELRLAEMRQNSVGAETSRWDAILANVQKAVAAGIRAQAEVFQDIVAKSKAAADAYTELTRQNNEAQAEQFAASAALAANANEENTKRYDAATEKANRSSEDLKQAEKSKWEGVQKTAQSSLMNLGESLIGLAVSGKATLGDFANTALSITFDSMKSMVDIALPLIFAQFMAREPFTGAILYGVTRALLMGMISAAQAAIPKFSKGGFTGDGAPADVAGIVHKSEYVYPAGLVRGQVGSFDALNSMLQSGVKLKDVLAAYRTKTGLATDIRFVNTTEARIDRFVSAVQSQSDLIASEVRQLRDLVTRPAQIEFEPTTVNVRGDQIEYVLNARNKKQLRR